MRSRSALLLVILTMCFFRLQAQVENIVVETYYISDAIDATDTTGGGLENRSVTYRIYVDLAAGSKLTKIYGDQNHALKFSSTELFFNNKADGQTFARNFSKVRLGENTVALDSWLTLGQATRNAAKTYFGILKTRDTDGSFIGGMNNDGGSAQVSGGLLVNNDPAAGIALTVADGLDTMAELPANWADYGFIDGATGVDSTIFGSEKSGNSFISYNAGLQNSGVGGVEPDSNLVLVAQLTTMGEISFELNLEVTDSAGVSMKYVASDSVLLQGEVLCRSLKYPFEQVCGCPDPEFLEYISDRDCDALDSCRNRIIYGCMDTLACNYNPDANFHISSLCCYPGYCNDRDISIVCPGLTYKLHRKMSFNLFPSPAADKLTFQSPALDASSMRMSVYDCLGECVLDKSTAASAGPVELILDVSSLQSGMYVFRVDAGGISDYDWFVKN